ncbi:MBL fold metallo-hydrolase [Metasolibacillus meyeri]|uniref:MBL fold metallo-hydrolase n=1 Tax=Metasolibacillus meyeri TaxID=1071052 RepID=A0AAW9NR23_9BACL|nr:MBL fold metallo-hydrolase [Metasolibacillus meyeri]MEC1178184.1 MBL fold metallo-hydrolase [Metasolibacillus meyeri]
MNIHKIVLPTPYAIGDVNVFLVKGDALTLFDAGPKTEEAYVALQRGIREAGYDMQDIEQVVLTHHHPDHAGWVDAFPKADVLGHRYVDYWMRQTADFLQYRESFYRRELEQENVPQGDIARILDARGELELFGTRPLTQFINDGDEVPGHPGLIAHETLGHAQSHFMFVEEHTGQAIGGDLLLEKVASNPLVEPPVDLQGDRPKSLLQYNASLKKLQQMNIATLYTGHGEAVTEINSLVTARLARQHERAMYVLQLMAEHHNVYDLTKALFGKTYAKQPGLTLSETLGQLDYLVEEGYARSEMQNGVQIYMQA